MCTGSWLHSVNSFFSTLWYFSGCTLHYGLLGVLGDWHGPTGIPAAPAQSVDGGRDIEDLPLATLTEWCAAIEICVMDRMKTPVLEETLLKQDLHSVIGSLTLE